MGEKRANRRIGGREEILRGNPRRNLKRKP
jgi:hypothetical protein